MTRIGIDVGSTTAKIVAIDDRAEIIFSQYVRHKAQAQRVIHDALKQMLSTCGDSQVKVCITGSVGMGIAEGLKMPFIQEVVAATQSVKISYGNTRTLIDIGGEDAKIVFFNENAEPTDLRMNGNCAGGTGAFIDQMAVIMGVDVDRIDAMAQNADRVYPIASRCGVFSKTDIQNLMAKNINHNDIAASIFNAIVVQTIGTLAHGSDIAAPILFCGGPLTFLPALRKAFISYLNISEADVIVPDNGALLPALGAALSIDNGGESIRLSELCRLTYDSMNIRRHTTSTLEPIFTCESEYDAWTRRITRHTLPKGALDSGTRQVYIGVDSGSTTTKVVVTDTEGQLLFSHYTPNNGNPINAVTKALDLLAAECTAKGCSLEVKGCCATGYGEDLIRTAFGFDDGIVETMAHYIAAAEIDPQVSFILDIGGQDMKALWVNNGIIDRIEINEACSSGCGTFIETFAKTLGYSVEDFCREGCKSGSPCDLGTRCTVFMNSKVKQVLREGASVADIASGLAYSVVKNCLYKVLKLTDTAVLGKHIVVQGGTMRNDAIVRALELVTGTEVSRCNVPELMGAYGCAIYARKHFSNVRPIDDIRTQAEYQLSTLNCKGCENNCLVSRYSFKNGSRYYSGNRCERIFNNGKGQRQGTNCYVIKNRLLFDRGNLAENHAAPLTIGIPRCLNTYENYPFWHALLTGCGINVRLSDTTDFARYESTAGMIMSDNICFPAKLAHSHIKQLIDEQVDRIFMPFVIFEQQGKDHNSYNCPIVTAYSEVIKSVQQRDIPIDSPAISFRDNKLLFSQCKNYLNSLGIPDTTIRQAFESALAQRQEYELHMQSECRKTLDDATRHNRCVILLAGRPYHTDPVVQHNISDMIASLGADVITEDIVRFDDEPITDINFLAQWSYPNRILRAAKWCARRSDNVQFVQLTSFGCGPDAFLTDQVRDLLLGSGKTFTLLKLDDINNMGSMKLRVRSLLESLRLRRENTAASRSTMHSANATVTRQDMHSKKIIVPFFTPYISPLIPAILKVEGYDIDTLPLSDTESSEWGLKYANNEICYPATLVVGDVIKALKSGKYTPERTIVAMTQTGGQCRASNYVMLIKKALSDAGYPQVPVLSLTFGSVDKNQATFDMNWPRVLPVALRAITFSDCISKFYHAAVVRETAAGQAAALRDRYLEQAKTLILQRRTKQFDSMLAEAAQDFNAICRPIECPRLGVVGEIYLKFNPFAHKNIEDWLTAQGIEVVPSILTDFFLESFVNHSVRVKSNIIRRKPYEFAYDWAYRLIQTHLRKVDNIASAFRYYMPFGDIFAEAEHARKVISLNAQFGEGWLLPAEIIAYSHRGINHVVSLQPFGCIANHIVARGIEKRLKTLYPQINVLSIDFDSGVSDVNITNRLLLFIHNLKNVNNND